jgi:hypothetical protein
MRAGGEEVKKGKEEREQGEKKNYFRLFEPFHPNLTSM